MSDLISANTIGRVGKRVKLLGIVLIILGILCFWAPQALGMTVSVVVGILLLLGGITRTLFAFVAPSWGSVFFRLIIGVLTIVAGVYMLTQPATGMKVLAMLLMVYLFLDGITGLVFAFTLKPVGGGAWLFLSAVASLLLGVLMWMQWPASGELAIGILLGVKLVLDGISLFGLGMVAREAGR